jgi:hypothetical protein
LSFRPLARTWHSTIAVAQTSPIRCVCRMRIGSVVSSAIDPFLPSWLHFTLLLFLALRNTPFRHASAPGMSASLSR